jgi:hypothetical protein
MKNVIITLCLTFNTIFALAQGDKNRQKVVAEFINYIKKNDREGLAKKIAFPFEREYPIPAIKNKADFLKRYKEVFDDNLVKQIVNSDPAKDWHDGGWRGIVFNDGEIWLDLDGRLLEVNGDSEAEKKIKAKMLAEDKKAVHTSLKDFKMPLYVLKTAKYLIRIDLLNNDTYRYASWKTSAKMTDKPDIVMTGKTVRSDGSGGNHSYIFKKGDYTYECAIITIGAEDSPPAMLTVFQGKKEILSQKAVVVLK